MGWKGVTVMDQKILFIGECLKEDRPFFNELCREFGISRKTGYKWLERYLSEGVKGLMDRPSIPRSCPHKTAEEIVEIIVRAKGQHPSWGPKKIIAHLSSSHPFLPAVSTASDILKRYGLVKRMKKHRRKYPRCTLATAQEPNDIWSVDYKGQFRMRNGIYCYPLTVCDMKTRYLLGIDAHDTVSFARTKAHFTRLFDEYGLPGRIRSDNGVPFASNAIARLSSLSVWWIKLGIYPERTDPASPAQNGRHERMHKTLKAEATIPPQKDIRSQQAQFDMFRKEYNDIRPHESLDQRTPSSAYASSPRKMPGRLGHFDYPLHYNVRRVCGNSCIRWRNEFIFVSRALAGEYVGLEQTDDGVYDVYFCDLYIGRLLEEKKRIADILERLPLGQIHNRREV
jgi:putative transposase